MAKESKLLEQVEKILEEIRPELQEEGEDVEVVAAEGLVVTIRLKGACESCPSAKITLYQMIKEVLLERVEAIEEVCSV